MSNGIKKPIMIRYVNLFLAVLLLNAAILKAQKVIDLNQVTITAVKPIDTVFGTWRFSVADFEFYEDKLVLLTFAKSRKHATILLVNASQKILSGFELPDEAQQLYKDYIGYINVICSSHVYRIIIKNETIHLASLPVDEYKKLIMPCIDTIGKNIYISNYQKEYPEFTYYAYNTAETKITSLRTVCDKEMLQGYNMEYYFLPPREQLQARKLADEYGVDKHRIAALMSGLTGSVFYTPLYAPLFVMNDTVCVFDHYANAIFKYDSKHRLLDSIPIDYNHPKSWREWKHQIMVDKESNQTYALYQRNGYCYLKLIDLNSGKIIGSFKLGNKYVDKMKIKNGYIYYVYRPFESLQEQFVYKELIRF